MKYAACLFVAFACVLLVSIGCSSTDDVINTPPVRFVDNGNGTVTDTQMGLIWLKSASCLGGRTGLTPTLRPPNLARARLVGSHAA